VDGDNGVHLVYVYTEALVGPDPDGDSNPTAAVYRYCQSECDTLQNWSSVTLAESVSEAQVAVTPDGHPRLLLLVRALEGSRRADRYLFAACNQGCTHRNGWQISPIVTVPNDLSWRWIDDPNDLEMGAREALPRRYFALDPAGRPRFVYYHYNTEQDEAGVGAYYAACDQSCTQAGSWTHTRITEVTDWSGTLEWEVLEKPMLTFAPDGSPRILAQVLPLGILRFTGLYYVACDGGCNDGSNWYKVQLGNGDDASGEWDLAVDSTGRGHMILAHWWLDGFQYAWCDADCYDFANWQFIQVSSEGGSELEVGLPDLEVDAQGRPRVAFKSSNYDETGNNALNSLSYLWCNTACRSTDAQWQTAHIESHPHLNAAWQGSIPPACAEGRWHRMAPSLALGATGTVQIAGDVIYVAPCQYDDASEVWEPGENYTHSTVWRVARTVSFAQP
jgi:hypothetical protein